VSDAEVDIAVEGQRVISAVRRLRVRRLRAIRRRDIRCWSDRAHSTRMSRGWARSRWACFVPGPNDWPRMAREGPGSWASARARTMHSAAATMVRGSPTTGRATLMMGLARTMHDWPMTAAPCCRRMRRCRCGLAIRSRHFEGARWSATAPCRRAPGRLKCP